MQITSITISEQNHLEKILKSLKSRPKSQLRITREDLLFQTIINAIQDKKGEQIVSLDLTKIDEAVSDFFIVCQASSNLQIKAIALNIESEVFEKANEKPYHIEFGEEWTLLDYVNVVVHIFKPEERKFYDIENLWMDSGRMEH